MRRKPEIKHKERIGLEGRRKNLFSQEKSS